MQNRVKIAIDLDDVLSSFVAEFLKWYNIKLGTNYDFNDFKDYHWSNWMDVSDEEAIEAVHEFFRTNQFNDLPVSSGAKEWVENLSKQHDLYLVTARQNVVQEKTHDWISRNFAGLFKGILFGNHYPIDGASGLSKGEICKNIGCGVIVDDNPQHIEALVENNIKVIILDKPWNKEIQETENVKRAYSWGDATKYIESFLVAVEN
ncbi:MAG: hypothetical protein U9M89_02285 [Patescibacteria group bacterium]|nr:hypothetical protein [Patescibacteria group bacterium]